jgi:phage recombination protein Bet
MSEALTVRKPRALEAMADRLNVEPAKLFDTLKSTVFKGASNEEMLALVVVANEYGLNPLLKEMYAFPAKGGGIVPLVGIDGWTKIVNRQPNFDGVEFRDVVNENGELVAMDCLMYRKDRSHPVIVRERMSECARNTEPWTKMGSRMLRHRVYIQAARLAFGISGLVDEDEAPDVQVVRSRPIKAEVMEGESRVVIPVKSTSDARGYVTSNPPPDTEKELADAGIAPVEERQITPQDKLMIYLQDYEITAEMFGAWAVKMGHLEQKPATWDDVPAELATKLWPARKRLANEIQAQCKS